MFCQLQGRLYTSILMLSAPALACFCLDIFVLCAVVKAQTQRKSNYSLANTYSK